MGPSQGGCGVALAGCGDGRLCTWVLEARLGMMREESWGWGITVLRLLLLRQGRDIEERRLLHFLSSQGQ